jgi:hypothetical protein
MLGSDDEGRGSATSNSFDDVVGRLMASMIPPGP